MANEGEEERPSPAMDDQTSNNNHNVSSESHDDTKHVHANENDDEDDEDDDLKRAKAAALEASRGGPMSSNSSDEHQKALLEKHTSSASHRNLFFHTTEKLVKGAPTPIQDLHKNWMKQHDQMNQNLTNQLNKFGIKLPGQGHGHAHGHGQATHHDSDEQQVSSTATAATVVADDHNAASKSLANETTTTTTTDSNQMDDTIVSDKSSNSAQGKTTSTTEQPPPQISTDKNDATASTTGEGGDVENDDDDGLINNEDGDDTAEGASAGPAVPGGTSRRSVVGAGGKLRLSNPLGLKKPAAASVVPSNVKKAFTSIAAGRKKSSYHTSSSLTVDEDGDGEGDDAEPASTTQETTTTSSKGAATDAVVPSVEDTAIPAKTETTTTGEGTTTSSSSAEPTNASVFRSPPTTADAKNGTAGGATGATTTTTTSSVVVAENDKQGSSSTEVTNTMHKKKKDVTVVNKTMEETKEATKARNAIAALASFDDTTPKASPSSSAELVVPVPTNQQQLRSASTPNIMKAIVPQQARLGGGSEPKVSSLHASYHSSNVTSPIPTIKTTNHDLVSSAAVPSLDLNSSTGSLLRTTIVWKRRDGLGGKFANLALLKQSPLWERRKLVLEDSKLSYFVLSESDKLGDWATQAALRAEAEAAAKSPAAGAGGGGGIQDIVHWWHETTAHATADVMSAVTGGVVSGDPTTTNATTPPTPTMSSVNSNNATATTAATGIAGPEGPRGTIDLLKENASIMTSTCSNYGMGGVVGSAGATAAVVGATSNTAPTPFCLTIKIHDQHAAKWKLCFDSHQQQLEWLVLLSNRSTIQSSIEEFVVDQSKSIAGGARMTCTLDPNTGLYVVKHRDNLLGSPTTTPTAITKKQAKQGADPKIPPPPPPIDTTSTAIAPQDDDPTMTLPRMTPSTKRTSPNTQSTVVSRGQAPKGTLSLRELTNHNTELPFLLLPSIWKRHYMYHTYVKPWFQISLSKQPTTTKTKKSKKSKSSSPKHQTTNVYYPYQPPITLYLIGDRLDLLLWICNICIIASYVHGGEWSLMKFVGFITMFNLMASLCCGQLEDFKLMGYASHEDAAAFADRVAQRSKDEIQPRTPKSPTRRGVWGFGKQRRSATTTTQQQQSPQPSGGDGGHDSAAAELTTMEETTEDETAVAMVTEQEEEDIESESEDEEEEPGEERRRKVAFDGIAGSTTVKFSSDTTPTKAPDNPQCLIGWRPLASQEIMLRDTGYATTKQKVPSPHSLYECVAVDVFQSSERIPNFVTQVKQLNRFLLKDSNSTNKFASPDLFVLTIALPCDAPKLGKPVDDGNGTTIVAYFRMTNETRQVLKFLQQVKEEAAASASATQNKQTNPTISSDHVSEIAKTLPKDIQNIEALINGVKLFDTWCDLSYRKKDATFQSRFKFLPQAVNSEEFGMPSYMAKYNGKPVLIKRAGVTGTLTNYPTLQCMEFDMNLHAFPYLAKQAFAYMKDAFCPYIVGNMACCIEGRSDAELPECLLGGFQIWYPDPTYTPTIDQFFAPSSSTQEETSENVHHDKSSK